MVGHGNQEDEGRLTVLPEGYMAIPLAELQRAELKAFLGDEWEVKDTDQEIYEIDEEERQGIVGTRILWNAGVGDTGWILLDVLPSMVKVLIKPSGATRVDLFSLDIESVRGIKLSPGHNLREDAAMIVDGDTSSLDVGINNLNVRFRADQANFSGSFNLRV